MLTSEVIKQAAAELGADLCGIGDIARYEGCDPQRDPRNVLARARCVIGFGFRVPRGLYDCMSRGMQFYNYSSLGVKYIDEEFSEILLLRMAALIENEGYDACVQRNTSNIRIKGDKTQNPELRDTYELTHVSAVSPEKALPDIIDFSESARICGLGSVSVKGNVLTREFGPYARFVYLITDAPLACDAPFEGSLCDNCLECAKACPGHAISEKGLDTWQCSVYYRGAHRSNPYVTDDFLKGHPERDMILDGRKRFDSRAARELYPQLDFMPSRTNGYVACICGKACDHACYQHLERTGALCRR